MLFYKTLSFLYLDFAKKFNNNLETPSKWINNFIHLLSWSCGHHLLHPLWDVLPQELFVNQAVHILLLLILFFFVFFFIQLLRNCTEMIEWVLCCLFSVCAYWKFCYSVYKLTMSDKYIFKWYAYAGVYEYIYSYYHYFF